MSRILTAEQVAEWLQIDVRTVQQYAREGCIPHVKVGRLYRFSEDEVEHWIVTEHRRSVLASARSAEDPKTSLQLSRSLGHLKSHPAT